MKTEKPASRRARTAGMLLAIAGAALTPIACTAEFDEAVDYVSSMVTGTVGPLPDNLDPEHAYEPALEGGTTGTAEDAAEEFNTGNLRESGGGIDVPTGSKASPLYGAQPFTQKMLRFEEFGLQPLPTSTTAGTLSFPTPADAESSPTGAALDAFLAQDIFPYPTRLANVTDLNPWQTAIESFLGRTLDTPPAEGRPPGEDWAHQRYTEFAPQAYFQVAQAGARDNLGARDSFQRHGYALGEFGPGGLYHNTTGLTGFDGTTDGIQVRFHPNFPVQNANAVWTFDGTMPPKLLMARYGEPLLMRHYNALPIDPAANHGFGLHTISTHEHNGHNPAESDGYTQAFYFPGQFYDYRWPMILAGHDSVNTGATDPRAGMPDGNGGITNIPGDWRETMSTHWFHDHMLDFTAQNVYKGNAAMMNYYSALDRGNEAINDGVNLRLPSGTALDWGNRDYDVNLVIADKAWDQAGQLFFNIFNLDGFIGDQILVNWLWKPYLDVRARRYRFRILNGSVSRYFKIALVVERNDNSGQFDGTENNTSYDLVPFYMIANDGNILEHSVHFNGSSLNGYTNQKGRLPTQAIAERYDIIVDFAQFAPGTKLYFVNMMEHDDGRGPKDIIPIRDILDGEYAPDLDGDRHRTDPTVGKFLEFRVHAYAGTDLSMDPAEYVAGNGLGPNGTDKTMIPLPGFTQTELDNAIHRTFEFGRSSGTDSAPWTVKTDGGSGLAMDPRRLSAAPEKGSVEIWHLENGGGGWAHPIHIHFEEGQIFRRDGGAPPAWERWARKDVYRVGPMPDSGDSVDIAIRFREFLGSFMEHCHNTQHEDHAMLMRWDLENPGQTVIMPTPMPSWDGVSYVPTFALDTFRTGDTDAAANASSNFGHLGN
ncbi:multicopper oxidase domain-containing protein [Haliangium ochraceum]|uniref:Bilirubin oxidase n=1 Tax=Haliangium ochraceum (strain DSM 14365 / JCM 11303 / SMP-2) TaxID=502025 RepID=D0LM88_HALO1|nr:multicopper oxidase domain-containing protein [Haliangium ochraceum]ACY16794.1 Bilirubin oxidase [Haliangium ochraceum DSM 14365]